MKALVRTVGGFVWIGELRDDLSIPVILDDAILLESTHSPRDCVRYRYEGYGSVGVIPLHVVALYVVDLVLLWEPEESDDEETRG